MAEKDELLFCGSCRRQQEPSQGEKCIRCNKQTVVWDTSKQKEEDVIKAWKYINGKYI